MIIDKEQLRAEARKSALSHDPFIKRKPIGQFWEGHVSDMEKIRSFVSRLQEKHGTCSQPAEEWLLDNAEFLEEQALTIKHDLSKELLHTLPYLSKTGEPRIISICKDYINATDGMIDIDTFLAYVQAYQEISVLKIAEVWSIPVMLRIALIHRLAAMTDELKTRLEICNKVDRLLSGLKQISPESLNHALEEAGFDIPLSGSVIVHLVRHLQERADYTATVSEWLSCKLENGTESLEQILSYEYQLQTSYQMSTGNIISGMRKLLRVDWHELFGKISLVEQTLRKDSTGIYPLLDLSSRNTLRKKIEQLSLRLHLPENLIASQAVALADAYVKQFPNERVENLGREASIAFYLLEPDGLKALRQGLKKCGEGKPRMMPENEILRRPIETYFNMLLLTFASFLIIFSLWIGWQWNFTLLQWLTIVAVLAIPALEWAVTAVHWTIERLRRPVPLLRYDFSKGIPKDAATMIVIPVIWSSKEEVKETTARLELHYLANRDPNLHFAILGDFKDADTEELEEDKQIIKAARKEIQRLQQSYPNGSFYYFQRKRVWNPAEKVWMGWERKRGKLVELVEFLKGKEDVSFSEIKGALSALKNIRYIITLDADAKLPLESAQRMIGAIHLPFNRPRLNKTGTRVIEGYGVLQPRVGMSHEAAMKSRFASLWSGDPGIDPYAFAVSDAYQDNFGQGIFIGKGIFDVNVFHQVLCDRIPDNRVLSHDLLEGGFLRTGLLSDIELIDDHPATFYSFQSRLHRWVRGDWQLLPWLARKVPNRRGKMVPVDLSILTRWQMIDNLRRSLLSPALYLTLLLAVAVLPGSPIRWFMVVIATLFLPLIRQLTVMQTVFKHTKGLLFTTGQILVQIITLPFQSILLCDAIGRTLYRLFISRQKLLEWVPSAQTERSSQKKGAPLLFGMASGYILILLFFLASLFSGVTSVQITGSLLSLLWGSAPLVVNWLNKPVPEKEVTFTTEEEEELRELSHQIWRFYEDYVTEGENWLPPDNVQIDPPKGIAHRTSPTNIGLYLACALAARDFAFIDTPGLIERIERTMRTLEKMEKWEGHLYNWYDTETLAPLPPKYVSTVDSGNLICSLVAVKEGLAEWMKHDFGIEKDDEAFPDDQSLHIAFSEELTPVSKGFSQKLHAQWYSRGKKLLQRIEAFIKETNFRPLYDHKARLFSLGYHLERNERDEVLYDLLASEARSASFAAIALGQVSVAHWNVLGRTMTQAAKRPLLLSWSGTMFEFLMPWLFMRTYKNTLWDSTYQAVVERQIEYANQRGVPFGISESGYYAFDHQMNYQYRAFGVPGLGFKRGLEQDLVVAPYATILALPFAKDAVLNTLKKFERLKARGKYGFYEALDFTKRRLPKNREYMVIRSFMAHHQGMSLLTLANVLLPHKLYERFHRNKEIQAAELLLQERIPKRPKLIEHPAMNRIHQPAAKMTNNIVPIREYASPHTRIPAVNILSNGTFTAVVSNAGSGYSQYKNILVSRWREDPVADPWGSYMYIRDMAQNTVWSPSYLPCRVESPNQQVQFSLERAVFTRTDGGIQTTMEVSVSPEWNAEIRRLSLKNNSQEEKMLEVTTFVELALSEPIADAAHPAFSKLFIRTEFDPDSECLVASRRPREMHGKTVWSAHSLKVEGKKLGSIEFETDRSSFIGRGYTLALPQGIQGRLRGQTGSVADPAFIMRRRFSIKPNEQVQLTAITSAADTREEAIKIVRHLNMEQVLERTYQMAWNRVQIELRHLHLNNKEAVEFQELAGRILYRSPLNKEQQASIAANKKGQSGLWSFGVSGDRPIVLLRIANNSHLPFIQKLLTGHEYLRRLGLRFDLVILNESSDGYQQNLQEAIQGMVEHGIDRFGAAPENIYIIPANRLSEEDKVLLEAAARLILKASRSSLSAQLRLPAAQEEQLPEALEPTMLPAQAGNALSTFNQRMEVNDWLFYNGWGGFSPDGKEYWILIKNGRHLPAPWINVIANPEFGFLISELGTGYTWWKNSRECKLTPWSNDPVLDPATETAFLRDEASGEVWTAAPPAGVTETAYKVIHGRGYSRFLHERNGIAHEMTMYVPLKDPIKIIKLKLKNQTAVQRELSLTYYAEWVLGVDRSANAPHIVTKWLESAQVLTAKNTYQETFREATAFLGIYEQGTANAKAVLQEQLSWTGDRHEFIGRNGNLMQPAALNRQSLSRRTGVFHQSCGAVQKKLRLLPGEEQTVYILLGCEESTDKIIKLVETYKQESNCEKAYQEVLNYWQQRLEQIQVSTPAKEMDILLNGWLLYQSLACRMWARTAFYQAGGAYGFRDQLQDSLALLHTLPELTKEQILRHASHQYVEGDVQHWWHEETERGIRTLFSDDLLWLPYTVSRYIEHTGDWTILDEMAPYITSEPLREDEHERYEATVIADETGTIYEHCLRAIDKALSRIGEHGLPLIGVGDWNDGMNLVGAKGRGESVWLGWFLVDILQRFASICSKRYDVDKEKQYQAAREAFISALNEHGWDGQWYRRAFTDAGQWLGSMQNEECRIDAIAQSWSVISGGAPENRAVQAMESFERELVERDLNVIRLLTPAFDKTEPSPGYIQGYPPGLRENGAQYTHGVIWGMLAWCQLGRGDKAVEMFQMLNPINHTRTDFEVKKYVGEPYVMAADVYTAMPKEGHAGWTWYTGAASWMYQAGIEWILGIRKRANRLYIDPKIPNEWPGFTVNYRFGKTSYMIEVTNENKQLHPAVLEMNGETISYEGDLPYIELIDDGREYQVQVKI